MKEKYLKEIEEHKKQIEELEKLVEKQENRKWKPEKNEIYYYINEYFVSWQKKYNDNIDKGCFSIGNYFKTKEDAEFEVERLKVLEEMKEFSYDFSDDEWKDNDLCKYFIHYDYEIKEIDEDADLTYKTNNIYFESEEDMQKCIDKVGEDRLIKYYFKVGR